MPRAGLLRSDDQESSEGVDAFTGLSLVGGLADSASRASDFATSAATWGCKARIGEGLVIGNAGCFAAELAGTENRSCTGGFAFEPSAAGSLFGAGAAGESGLGERGGVEA